MRRDLRCWLVLLTPPGWLGFIYGLWQRRIDLWRLTQHWWPLGQFQQPSWGKHPRWFRLALWFRTYVLPSCILFAVCVLMLSVPLLHNLLSPSVMENPPLLSTTTQEEVWWGSIHWLVEQTAVTMVNANHEALRCALQGQPLDQTHGLMIPPGAALTIERTLFASGWQCLPLDGVTTQGITVGPLVRESAP